MTERIITDSNGRKHITTEPLRPRLDHGPEYERGFVDGRLYQTQTSVDKAVNAIAQPAQEPVAWGVFEGNLHDIFFTQAEAQKMAELKGNHAEVRPLYTTPPHPTPPQRPWVELEGKEIRDMWEEATKPERSTMTMVTSFAKAIEAKLKEKNT